MATKVSKVVATKKISKPAKQAVQPNKPTKRAALNAANKPAATTTKATTKRATTKKATTPTKEKATKKATTGSAKKDTTSAKSPAKSAKPALKRQGTMAGTIEAAKKILGTKKITSRKSSTTVTRKRASPNRNAREPVPTVSRSNKIKRTNSIKQVIKDAKKILKK